MQQCIGDTEKMCRVEQCIGDTVRRCAECGSVLAILREGVQSVTVYWRHCEKECRV